MNGTRFVDCAIALSVAALVMSCARNAKSEAARRERSSVARNPTVDLAGQARQLRAAVNDPTTIDDKLFILWEYAGALRERELAIVVLARTSDPELKALAELVRDGHQLGMDAMRPSATELGLTLPEGPTDVERAAIEAAAALPTADLERFFLRRQRAMHAWDVTAFDDYSAVASSASLKRYVAATRQPLRAHADLVVKLANKNGIPGGLAQLSAQRP
jgi:putative membrane protein